MPPRQTKQKIFEAGMDLLGEDGFAGLTLGTLATKSGMSKSGLFAHFKSKAELEEQLIDQVMQKGYEHFIAPALKQPPGLARLSALFNGWIGWTFKVGLKGGCPMAAGLFELDDAPAADPTRVKLQEISAHWHQNLLGLCNEAVSTGELKPDLDKEQFVFEMYGIYLSHHVEFRFNKNPQADERAKRAFARLVKENSQE